MGSLWKVIVVTVDNGNVVEDYHYFMTEAEADAFYAITNRQQMQYALKPIKVR